MVSNRISIIATLSLCLLATVSRAGDVPSVKVIKQKLTESKSKEVEPEEVSVIETTAEAPAEIFVDQQSSVIQSGHNHYPTECQQEHCHHWNAPRYQPLFTNENRPMFMSDHSFDGFIQPVTNFVGAIDPRSRTRVRGVFANQMIPDSSILGDGDLQLYAMQASIAINERLSIIAEKDGYITMQTQGAGNRRGWADISAGLKYVLVRDVENQRLLSGGIMYDLPTGSDDVFQGNNDGIWTTFLSGGQEFANGKAHAIGTVGWRLPNNKSKDTESLYYSLHLDYEVFNGWYALWEFNGIIYTDSGSAIASPQEGGDLINLGANNVDGNHVATTALGVTRVFNRNLSASVAYEVPVTDRKDLFDNRVTATITLAY